MIIEQAPVQAPEWTTEWELNDPLICGFYGVEQKTDAKGKHYRAFCKVARNEKSHRFESAEFTARDDADLNISGWHYVPEEITQREKKVAEIRSVMLPTEAAPSDMRKLANELRTEAAELHKAWIRQEELDRQATKDGEFFTMLTRAVAKATPEQRSELAKMLLGDSEKQEKPEKPERVPTRKQKERV
jgi:hypothetical protein